VLTDLIKESAVAAKEIVEYITYIIGLTKLFPVCIEIDVFGLVFIKKCHVGHFRSELKYPNPDSNDIPEYISVFDMVSKIIIMYGNEPDEKFPLIIHLDVYNINCVKNLFENNICENDCDFSNKPLNECMGKIIFKENILEKINKIKKIGINNINQTSSVGISLTQLTKLEKSITSQKTKEDKLVNICKTLNVNSKIVQCAYPDWSPDKLHYRIYPKTGNGGQEVISYRLILLINKLFEVGYSRFSSNFMLPTLIAFNLYHYWNNFKPSNNLKLPDNYTPEFKSMADNFTILVTNFTNLYSRTA